MSVAFAGAVIGGVLAEIAVGELQLVAPREFDFLDVPSLPATNRSCIAGSPRSPKSPRSPRRTEDRRHQHVVGRLDQGVRVDGALGIVPV
jgi:hypothetical protein